MKHGLLICHNLNKTLYSFFLCLLLMFNYSDAFALSCAFNPYQAIKNVKNDLKTAVFIGKVTFIDDTTNPDEGVIVSFEPYVQWMSKYNTLHTTLPNNPNNKTIKVLVRKIPHWTSSFGVKGNQNNEPKELAFFPEVNKTYFILARKDESYKHHYIESHCHGSFEIDYSLLKMIDRFKLLGQPIPSNRTDNIAPDRDFPSQTTFPPEYKCLNSDSQESLESSTDVFEGTLIRYNHAYSKKGYPAVEIPDLKKINPEYDYFNIAEYDFIVHRSWKGGYVNSLEHNFTSYQTIPVGVRKVYSYNEDRWCGMFNNDTGCGVKLKEGERYIIYSNKSQNLINMVSDVGFDKEPYSTITKCSRIVKADNIKTEIETLKEPLYEIKYNNNPY